MPVLSKILGHAIEAVFHLDGVLQASQDLPREVEFALQEVIGVHRVVVDHDPASGPASDASRQALLSDECPQPTLPRYPPACTAPRGSACPRRSGIPGWAGRPRADRAAADEVGRAGVAFEKFIVRDEADRLAVDVTL